MRIPVAGVPDSKTAQTARQFIIAKIGQLKILNRQEVSACLGWGPFQIDK